MCLSCSRAQPSTEKDAGTTECRNLQKTRTDAKISPKKYILHYCSEASEDEDRHRSESVLLNGSLCARRKDAQKTPGTNLEFKIHPHGHCRQTQQLHSDLGQPGLLSVKFVRSPVFTPCPPPLPRLLVLNTQGTGPLASLAPRVC